MNKIFIFLLAVLVLTGCRSTYDVTLTNGTKLQDVSKPVLDKGTGHYRFALPDGKEMRLPQSRIRLIEPHGDNSGPQFVSPTQKR